MFHSLVSSRRPAEFSLRGFNYQDCQQYSTRVVKLKLYLAKKGVKRDSSQHSVLFSCQEIFLLDGCKENYTFPHICSDGFIDSRKIIFNMNSHEQWHYVL